MKILRLDVEGFRSLKLQIWRPGDLNVVIGPNASGKSNLLRALESIHLAAVGKLGDCIRQEGGMEPILWDGRAHKLDLRIDTTPIPPYSDTSEDALTYSLVLSRLGSSSAYRIEREFLGNFRGFERGEIPAPFILLERDTNHAMVFSMDRQRFVAPPESVPEDESLLSMSAGPFTANPFIGEFQKELAAWAIHQRFHTHREASIRTPQVTRAETQVDPDGQNLIAVLHTLYTTSREFRDEINTAMRGAAFGEEFEELVFPPAADQRIQLRVRWRSPRREISAADLSDGTLRFLFLITVLANPSPPPLIAIDEPETGLHPSMLPIVAEYAREASERSQVILTTHSPEFLDAFGDDPPTTTVVEWKDGETLLRTLSGEELAYWLRQYSLGELYRSRELEAMR